MSYKQQSRVLLPILLILGLIFFDFNIVKMEAVRLRAITFLMAVFIVLYGAGLVSGRYRRRGNDLEVYVLLVIWVSLLSVINLFNKPNGFIFDFFTSVVLLVVGAFTAICLAGFTLSYININRILRIWVYFSIPVSIYAIYQGLSNYLPLPLLYLHPLLGIGGASCLGNYCRPASIFSEPSHLGAFLLPPLIIQGVYLLNRIDTRLLFSSRKRNSYTLLVTVIAFFLAYSEVAYIALGAAGLILMFTLLKESRNLARRLLKFGGVIVVLIVVLIGILQYYNSDFLQGFILRTEYALQMFSPFHEVPNKPEVVVSSASGRYFGTIRALRIWLDHPLLGVGLNNSENYFDEYTIQGHVLPSVPGVGWATILSDLGIIGLLTVILLYAKVIHRLKIFLDKDLALSVQAPILSFYLILWTDIFLRFAAGDLVDPRKWLILGFGLLVVNSIEYQINSNRKRR